MEFLNQIPVALYYGAAALAGLLLVIFIVMSASQRRRRDAAMRNGIRVYQRKPSAFIGGLVGAPFAGIGIYLVILWVYQFWAPEEPWGTWLMYGLPALAVVLVLLSTIFSDNIRFELSERGQLRYFKRNRLVHEWVLPQCRVGYYHKTVDGSDSSIRFTIADDQGNEDTVDCEALGGKQFHEMFDALQTFTLREEIALEAQ